MAASAILRPLYRQSERSKSVQRRNHRVWNADVCRRGSQKPRHAFLNWANRSGFGTTTILVSVDSHTAQSQIFHEAGTRLISAMFAPETNSPCVRECAVGALARRCHLRMCLAVPRYIGGRAGRCPTSSHCDCPRTCGRNVTGETTGSSKRRLLQW